MPKVTGNDLVVQTLQNEGVDTVFYLTGGPMSDVAGLCLEMQFKSMDVRHEQAAAMMAHGCRLEALKLSTGTFAEVEGEDIVCLTFFLCRRRAPIFSPFMTEHDPVRLVPQH